MNRIKNIKIKTLNILLSFAMIITLVSFAGMNKADATDTNVSKEQLTFKLDNSSTNGMELFYSINGEDLKMIERGETISTDKSTFKGIIFFTRFLAGYQRTAEFINIKNSGGVYKKIIDVKSNTLNTFKSINIDLTSVYDQAALQGCTDQFFYTSTKYNDRIFKLESKPVKIKALYNSDGGSDIVDDNTYYHENYGGEQSEITVKNAPTREGYLFTGWLSNVNNKLYFPGEIIDVMDLWQDTTENTVNYSFTAQWQKIIPNITVSFVTELTKGSFSNQVDKSILVLPKIEKNQYTISSALTYLGAGTITPKLGYIFEGWYDVKDDSKNLLTGDTVLNTSTTYIAKYRENPDDWVNVTYKTTGLGSFIYNDVTYSNSITTHKVLKGTTFLEAGFTLPIVNVLDDHYDSNGFYIEGSTDRISASTVLNSNLTLVASYLPKKYTLTYNLNNGNDAVIKQQAYLETVSFPENPIKASDNQYNYTFDHWEDKNGNQVGSNVEVTNDETYNAIYNQTERKYTIKFVDGDGNTLQNDLLGWGSTVEYTGATPTKSSTAEYGYEFTDWDKTIVDVNGDSTYTAIFKTTKNKYTVKFVNDDDSILDTQILEYGVTPEYLGATPTKTSTNNQKFEFSGWTPLINKVTGDTTYKAKYEASTRKYTVTFKNIDGSIISTSSYEYGQMPTKPTATYVNDDATYVFNKWDKTVKNVDNDVIYTATYYKYYTINFYDGINAEAYDSIMVLEGQIPTLPTTNPKKAETDDYLYTFVGYGDISAATSHKDYTAQYTATPKFLVEFKSVLTEAGESIFNSVISSLNVVEGNEASAPTIEELKEQGLYTYRTQAYTYTFDGWDETFNSITSSKTINALYKSVLNQYTYRFYDADGTTLLTKKTVDYGTIIEAPTAPTKAADNYNTYVFNGWNKEVSNIITDDVTYTATYKANPIKYTVTFKNDDGTTILEKTNYHYGESIIVPSDPTKQQDEQFIYTFAGWNEDVSDKVTGNITYTATYESTLRSYNVQFMNDEDVLQEGLVDYGIIPQYVGNTPMKEADEENTYEFAGWDIVISPVKGEQIYKATFNSTKIDYTVTFKNDDGTTILEKTNYHYGESIIVPSDPTKQQDEQFIYTFAGWNEDVSDKVTGNTTYTATYESTLRSYKVQFMNDEDVLQEELVDYGTTPQYVGNTPMKASTAQYSYTFAGWSPEISVVQGNQSYKALFEESLRSYQVSFVDYDDTIISNQTVEYGNGAIVPNNPSRDGYTFIGWDGVFDFVTGNVVLRAQYELIPEVVETPSDSTNVNDNIQNVENVLLPTTATVVVIDGNTIPLTNVDNQVNIPIEQIIENNDETNDTFIEDNQTALSNGQSLKHWAIINFILMGITMLFGVLVIFSRSKHEEDEETNENIILKRYKSFKLASTIIALLSIVVFFLTEDMTAHMTLTDQYTLVMGITLFVQCIMLALNMKCMKEEVKENC